MKWIPSLLLLLKVYSVQSFNVHHNTAIKIKQAFRVRSTTASNDVTALEEQVASPLEFEALSKFFTKEQIQRLDIEPAEGGVSNRMSFVKIPEKGDGAGEKIKYLLRIYNNGGNSKVVKFEHEIMRQLNSKCRLSFATPKALPTLSDPNETHVCLTSGDESCVFEVIPGALPKLKAVEEIGRASGELHTAMSTLSVDRELSDTPPYHDLYAVHHATNRDIFYETISSATFDAARQDIDILVQHVRDLEERLTLFRSKNLPEQLIHGDLHYDNVLIDEESEKVTGMLDFEYCGFDWRAMELAVCLSKYAGEDEPLPYMKRFISGFSQTATLTDDEIDSIPDLMILRILSNVIYFIGRVISGEDSPDQLISRAGLYNSRIEWLIDNRRVVSDYIASKMSSS